VERRSLARSKDASPRSPSAQRLRRIDYSIFGALEPSEKATLSDMTITAADRALFVYGRRRQASSRPHRGKSGSSSIRAHADCVLQPPHRRWGGGSPTSATCRKELKRSEPTAVIVSRTLEIWLRLASLQISRLRYFGPPTFIPARSARQDSARRHRRRLRREYRMRFMPTLPQ